MTRWTYSKAGIDIQQIRRVQEDIKKRIEPTFRSRKNRLGRVLSKFGHYASLVDMGNNTALAVHADGCGTKVLLAQLMNKYDTIGADCVAMCVNDIICLGAKPLGIVDYLALEKADRRMINQIISGLSKAANSCDVTVLGGETAVMPDVINGAVPGKGFDLAAVCFGIVQKNQIVTGESIKPGDAIVGLDSSGIHSNGLTLARKVLLDDAGLSLSDRPSELGGKTLGQELLKPTQLYVHQILASLKNIRVKALAHITGGAFTKLSRFWQYTENGFLFNNLPPPPKIFDLIRKLGNISHDEMYRTFNMGLGFCAVIHEQDVKKMIRICKLHSSKAMLVGEITREKRIAISPPGIKQITLAN